MEACDNKSVGVIVSNERGEVLLLNRAKFPFGLAPPAGHVDSHGSIEQTAIGEVQEEVGVEIEQSQLVPVLQQRVDNACRRGGEYHDWTIFEARVSGSEIIADPDETLGASWWSQKALAKLVRDSRVLTERTQGEQLLEPIWVDVLAAYQDRA